MKSRNACLTGHVISMLIHSPTTRIQDLGILRRDAACIMQRIILSCHSRGGRRGRSNVCKRAEHFHSTREIRASLADGRGNVNRIGIDPQIAAVRERNGIIGVGSTTRRSIEVTPSTTGADDRFDINSRGLADRVDLKVFASVSSAGAAE